MLALHRTQDTVHVASMPRQRHILDIPIDHAMVCALLDAHCGKAAAIGDMGTEECTVLVMGVMITVMFVARGTTAQQHQRLRNPSSK